MSKDITVSQDTIRRQVIKKTVYKYRIDSVYVKKQQREEAIIDSLLKKKMK
jgi:hypothetical protein